MSLEMLKNVTEIGGFKLSNSSDDINNGNPIVISQPNIIHFQIQDGPIGEVGVNGCQVDTIIEAAKLIIEGFNKKFPCRENSMIITKLDEALMWSDKRKKDRLKRGVEGTNKS